MYGIIIVNQQVGHNEYKIKRFKEECKNRNINLEVFENDGTLGCIENGETKTNLPKCDFVLYLDKDIYLARTLEKAGYRLFNKADFIKMCDDKMLTFIYCSNLGIRMPITYAGPLVYLGNEKPSLGFLDRVAEKLSFPLIVKKVYGSLGEGIYKVNNMDELTSLYKEICHSPVVFQQYIPSKHGRSVRVLIIDGKVVGCFARVNNDDFRSNYGTTASSELIANPEKYLSFARDIANKLNIEYAGIDLLDDINGEPILCEINSNAFFEEFEKCTGIDAAKLYIDMVVGKVEKHEQK